MVHCSGRFQVVLGKLFVPLGNETMGILPYSSLIQEAFAPKPFVNYKPNYNFQVRSAPGQFTPRDDMPTRTSMDNSVNLSVEEVYALFASKNNPKDEDFF